MGANPQLELVFKHYNEALRLDPKHLGAHEYLGEVYLTVGNAPTGWAEAIVRGVVLGLAAYGAYDLTNLAIIRDWPVKISVIDMAWGGFISAAATAGAYAATWARN